MPPACVCKSDDCSADMIRMTYFTCLDQNKAVFTQIRLSVECMCRCIHFLDHLLLLIFFMPGWIQQVKKFSIFRVKL